MRARSYLSRGPLHAAPPASARDGDVLGMPVPPLIPAGEYDAVGVGWSRRRMLGGAPRIIVEWDVLVPDPEAELGRRRVRVSRYYRVEIAPGGRVRAPRSSDYARDWMRVTGQRIHRL